MKKTYFLLIALSVFTFGFSQTIMTVDRAQGTGPTATDNIATVSSIGLTRGVGVNFSSTTNVNFTSNDWTIGGDQPTAEANNDYIEWSVTANTTFEIALEALDIQLRRNPNGPSDLELFYSLDGFTTAGTSYSGVQTLAADTNTIFNLVSPGPAGPPAPTIDSGASGTITFRLYAWGATSIGGYLRVMPNNTWALSAPLPFIPGIRLIGTVSTASPNSIESDIVASTFSGVPNANIDYTFYNATSGLSAFNSTPLGAFTIRDGGAALSDTDTDPTILNSIEFSVANSENIAAIAIFDGFTNIAEVTTVTPLTNITGLSLTAADNSTQQFLVFATFKSTVTDNAQIQLTISNTTTPATGSSLFAAANAGGAQTSIAGDDNRIEVTVSQFLFNQQPTDSNELEVMVSFPTILGVDVNLNQDLDANITGINVTTIPASSIVTETYDMINGEATLDNVVFTSTETGISLVATETSFSSTSSTFDINGPLISIAEQNFDTAIDWSYISDTPFRENVADWGNTLGYFGEIALSNASPIDNPVFSDQIFGENDLNDGASNPFAILTFTDIDVSTFSDIKILFDWQVVGYVTNANDIDYRIATNGSVFADDWTPVFDGNGSVNDEQGRIKIVVPDGSTSVALQVRLRNNLPFGYSGFDNFRVVSEFSGLIYSASTGWKDNIKPDATTGALNAFVIDGTYNVSEDVQIDNLIINSGATTVIDFGKSITTNSNLINTGTLELNSISNNYSSLIVGGFITNEVIYKRHVNQIGSGSTGNNDLISPPVTNTSQTFGSFRAANSNIPEGTVGGGTTLYFFGPFDNNNATNPYTLYSASDDAEILTAGKGYRTASTDNSEFTFTGDVQTGTVPVGITTGSASYWNLIGNPYPSYITLIDFLDINNLEFDPFTSGVYGYDGDASNGWTIWNQATAEDDPSLLIAPGQGFFVSSSLTGSGTINFTPTMRSIGTTDDFIPGRPDDQNLAHLKLLLSNGDALYNTDFYFNDNASLGMDIGYDSALFNDTTPNFAMYSHLVENNLGRDMAIQSVSYSDLDNVTIPLGINIVQGEQATVSILESNIPEGITVILEDNISNTFTDLQTGDYTFTPTTTLTETGRFYIHLSRGTLGTTENVLNGLEIYTTANPKQIVVKGLLENKTTFQLYDIQGRLVNTQLLNTNDTKHSIDVSSLSAGIYVVQLQNTTGNRTQKVILK